MDTNPTLIEPGVRYFIGGTLKECRRFKDRNISIIFNISMLATICRHYLFGTLLSL